MYYSVGYFLLKLILANYLQFLPLLLSTQFLTSCLPSSPHFFFLPNFCLSRYFLTNFSIDLLRIPYWCSLALSSVSRVPSKLSQLLFHTYFQLIRFLIPLRLWNCAGGRVRCSGSELVIISGQPFFKILSNYTGSTGITLSH